MKKGWEMYPEKILLMISGIAFLLLIIPAELIVFLSFRVKKPHK